MDEHYAAATPPGDPVPWRTGLSASSGDGRRRHAELLAGERAEARRDAR
ncbi:MAG: hypothetical protein ABW195_05685 [Ilumatobacteraceae bacterium]